MRALPTGRLDVSGIPFEIVEPAQNNRNACIAIAGAMRPYFAKRVAVDVPSVHGRYLYLLNGLAWGKQKKGEICGQLNISYDDGTMTTIELKSGINSADFWGAYALDEALVGWQNRNESSPIGLYASWFPLASGKAVTNIEFVSRGQVWMILAATISSKFPDEQSLARKVQSITSDWGGEFRDSSAIRIFGKPNTITEWNYCYPNPTCAEEQIIMPASAALQGFDGLYHFCYAHAKNMDITRINVFDVMNNPMKRLGVGMGNLLFRRDVAESQTILPYDHTKKVSGLAQLSIIAKTGMLDPSNPNFQQKPIPSGLQSEALVLKLIEQGRLPAECYDATRKIARSTTGEIEMNQKEHHFLVRTNRTEVFVLPNGAHAAGKVLAAQVSGSPTVVGVSALDAQPLNESRRILMLHLTQNLNKNTVLGAPDMNVVYDEGELGVLVKRGTADVTLATPQITKIYACSAEGKRLFEQPFKRQNGKISFTADIKSNAGPIMVYELLSE